MTAPKSSKTFAARSRLRARRKRVKRRLQFSIERLNNLKIFVCDDHIKNVVTSKGKYSIKRTKRLAVNL